MNAVEGSMYISAAPTRSYQKLCMWPAKTASTAGFRLWPSSPRGLGWSTLS